MSLGLKHRKESKIMKQKEQQLLLKELCARSPYGVKVVYLATTYSIQYVDSKFGEVKLEGMPHTVGIGHIKLYLRPMSSMTDEEFNSLKEETALNYNNQLDLVDWNNGCKTLEFWLKEIPSYVAILVFDWLNSHHFDYRALIDRGLALEAPEGMYK